MDNIIEWTLSTSRARFFSLARYGMIEAFKLSDVKLKTLETVETVETLSQQKQKLILLSKELTLTEFRDFLEKILTQYNKKYNSQYTIEYIMRIIKPIYSILGPFKSHFKELKTHLETLQDFLKTNKNNLNLLLQKLFNVKDIQKQLLDFFKSPKKQLKRTFISLLTTLSKNDTLNDDILSKIKFNGTSINDIFIVFNGIDASGS